MWSEGVTGRQGAVGGETNHRIGVCMPMEVFIDSSLGWIAELVGEGLLSHIEIQCRRISNVDCAVLGECLEKVRTAGKNPTKRVMYTLSLDSLDYENEVEKDILCRLSPSLQYLSVPYQLSREYTVRCLNELKLKMSSGSLTIGLHNFPENELQWILDHSEGVVSFLNLGNHTAPNVKMRTIDFGHSHLCNIMVSFGYGNGELSKYDYMRTLSERYGREPSIVLAKAFLQLGVVVMFSHEYGPQFLAHHVLPLAHPFTYRHPVLAPEKPKTFIVSDPDIQFVIASSEVAESASDETESISFSGPSQKRHLSFPVLLNKES